MIFEPSLSQEGRTQLNHLKEILYWHRPGGGLMEVLMRMKDTQKSDPTELTKEYIELYVASLLGMGLEISEKKTFWIAKPPIDPPDFVFMTMTKDTKGRIYFSSREVEITRFISLYTKTNLLQTILAKDITYPEDYIIICFLETDSIEDLRSLSNELIDKLKHISHVFVVFVGMPLSDYLNKYSAKKPIAMINLVQLSPVFDSVSFDLTQKIEEWKRDGEKLVYVDGREVFYGKRNDSESYPSIL